MRLIYAIGGLLNLKRQLSTGTKLEKGISPGFVKRNQLTYAYVIVRMVHKRSMYLMFSYSNQITYVSKSMKYIWR